MQLLEWILKIDQEAFVFIHSVLSTPFLDPVFLLLRNALVWIPLYGFLLYWCYRNKPEALWKFLLVSVLCFAVTDITTARILKQLFARERPCFNEEIMEYIRGIINCGGRHSLPSSHAANHMGLATFWFLSIQFISGRKWYWLFVWTGLICYAQVYVGKHYPVDILAGLLVGWIAGVAAAMIFKKWTRNFAPGKKIGKDLFPA